MKRTEQTLSLYRAIPETMSHLRRRSVSALEFGFEVGRLHAGFRHKVDTEDGAFDEYRLVEVQQHAGHTVLLVGRRSERIEDTSYMGDDGQVVTMEGDLAAAEREASNLHPFITAHAVISKRANRHGFHSVVVERVRHLSRSLIVQYLNHILHADLVVDQGPGLVWIRFACKSVPRRERLERLIATKEAEVRLQRSGFVDDSGALTWDLTKKATASGSRIATWVQGAPDLDDWESMTLCFNSGDAKVQTRFDPRKRDLLEALWTERAIVELDPPVTQHWRKIDARVVKRAVEFIG